MTEYEIRDLTASYMDVASTWYGHYSTWMMIYLTLVFGFCVVVYAVHEFNPELDVDSLRVPWWVLYGQRSFWLVTGVAPVWFLWDLRRRNSLN